MMVLDTKVRGPVNDRGPVSVSDSDPISDRGPIGVSDRGPGSDRGPVSDRSNQ